MKLRDAPVIKHLNKFRLEFTMENCENRRLSQCYCYWTKQSSSAFVQEFKTSTETD